MTKPTIGRTVHYTTTNGATLPAVIVNVHESGSVNLQVFTDESLPNIRHKTEVDQAAHAEPGKFHFPEIVKSEKGHKEEK